MTRPSPARAATAAAALALAALAGCASVPERVAVQLDPSPAPATITGSATFTVGLDVAPGRYTTTAPPSCYYARLSELSGDPGAVIASGRGPGTRGVVIEASDAAFVSIGCGTWSVVATAAGPPASTTTQEARR